MPDHPWQPFFKRAEDLATSAFLTIPFVGPAIADYFVTIVVPVCSPPRDRVIGLLSRCLRGVQGRAAAAALRLLPAPRKPG
ncbi:MAG TPA: hypothetical protein VF950_18150 [Planctomycetota bacterium]